MRGGEGAAIFLTALGVGILLGLVLFAGLDPTTEVDPGVGRTFECRTVDAVKVEGYGYIEGKACRAVDKEDAS